MLEQICRTCLATCGELVPIFSDEYYVHDLPDKLLHTTKIEVLRDDDLPKMMCKKCIFLVDSLYCFKDQCEMAEIKLKETLKKTVGDHGLLSNNVSAIDERSCDSYNIEEVEIHSDEITSSEEEYHIEYVSEEARLEVENARRRSRNARKRRNKYSINAKVISVNVVPPESRNSYDNMKIASSSKCDVIDINEDDISTDNYNKNSLFTSQGLRKFANNTLNKKDHYIISDSAEDINFLKDQVHDNLEKSSVQTKAGHKRKLENSNSINELLKVPKKVMFKENDYNVENIEFIEVSENEMSKANENVHGNATDDLNSVLNFNLSQNNTEKDFQHDDGLECSNSHISDVLSNSLSVNEHYDNALSDSDAEKIIELRMQNLLKRIVLTIPEVCTECSQTFETHLDVLKHKIETHLSFYEDHYFCPICQEKFFTNYYLIDHLIEHKDIDSYVCTLCFGNFYNEDTVRDHLHSHVDLRDMRCQICSKKFVRMQTLLNHLDEHITSKSLLCHLCTDNNFKSKDELQNHIHQEHKNYTREMHLTCETCGLEVPENEMKEHAKTHNNYPCPYCERSFTTKTILRDHVLTHLGVQQFSCLVCNKTFVTQDERTLHMQEHMKPQQKNEQKKFRCRVCHEILLSRIAYGQHLKEKHWSAKQTSEILQELSESSLNEKVNEQLNKCTSSTSELIS
ncbi:PREDICTED: zinc finger protein 510-like [Ceratosolen solmsi marchali]|uniref:Zinc finger protein 510-like n=1 Tax=Ceratosolen solmsi marchali TaxID=326594 RepID=A0AAJ6YB88_9HYME|nr:PREDICTED: zinc finger protein 510-like [Ceratosolen solmsi marchali]